MKKIWKYETILYTKLYIFHGNNEYKKIERPIFIFKEN